MVRVPRPELAVNIQAEGASKISDRRFILDEQLLDLARLEQPRSSMTDSLRVDLVPGRTVRLAVEATNERGHKRTETIDLVFMPHAADDAGGDGKTDEGEADAKWDDREPLINGVVDLGALATEFLVLGIDPYPRKPGAVFEPPQDSRAEENPFAALAGWTKGRGDA